ncbi:MAG TPA: RHS repeat-associated core domain-containing protein, partial [Alphaproteobacteria bacterium]|nr:RHS repeat-associated core domain-containing protein [Alphaproteobacteria bacterium]
AKGIIAAQIAAAQRLRSEGLAAGLLFLVGEERDSLGARVANQRSPGGLNVYRGPDWLGSSRMATSSWRTAWSETAYAPYGEPYATSGALDLSFTEQTQNTVFGLYDFMFREYHPVQGRWVSPDPIGIAAVSPTDPQSWNRYGYVRNTPSSLIDPLGLCMGGLRSDACNPRRPWYDALHLLGELASRLIAAQNGQPWALSYLAGGTVSHTITWEGQVIGQGSTDFAGVYTAIPAGSGGSAGRDLLGTVGEILMGEVRQPGEGLLECANRAQQTLLGETGSSVLNNTAIISAGTLYALGGTAATYSAGLPITVEEALKYGSGQGIYRATFAEAAGYAGVGVGTEVGARFLTVASQAATKVVVPVAVVSTGVALGFIFACR